MKKHLERALLLYEQSKYELAEQEARQALLEDNGDAMAHGVLGLCLCQREQSDEATREAQAGVAAAPDLFFSHFALAHVFYHRNRYADAQKAVEEAIRLNPAFDSGHGLLAAIHFASILS